MCLNVGAMIRNGCVFDVIGKTLDIEKNFTSGMLGKEKAMNIFSEEKYMELTE